MNFGMKRCSCLEKAYEERERKKYLKAHPEEVEQNVGEPFISVNFTEVVGLKLKGWTEGDPF